jgi:hypothetical protein
MTSLDLDINDLKERLFGVMNPSEQWSIVFVMYMEDYEKKHPSSKPIATDEEMTNFIERVSNRLVANGTISKNSDGKFVYPKLNIFQ